MNTDGPLNETNNSSVTSFDYNDQATTELEAHYQNNSTDYVSTSLLESKIVSTEHFFSIEYENTSKKNDSQNDQSTFDSYFHATSLDQNNRSDSSISDADQNRFSTTNYEFETHVSDTDDNQTNEFSTSSKRVFFFFQLSL